jgi:hypothetical protein
MLSQSATPTTSSADLRQAWTAGYEAHKAMVYSAIFAGKDLVPMMIEAIESAAELEGVTPLTMANRLVQTIWDTQGGCRPAPKMTKDHSYDDDEHQQFPRRIDGGDSVVYEPGGHFNARGDHHCDGRESRR